MDRLMGQHAQRHGQSSRRAFLQKCPVALLCSRYSSDLMGPPVCSQSSASCDQCTRSGD